MTRVLIVDDDPSTLASLSRAFRLAGHEAVVCDNAARGIELVRAERFDVVFSDVVMPGKDGLAMLEELRERGLAIPIIMMSGREYSRTIARTASTCWSMIASGMREMSGVCSSSRQRLSAAGATAG